MKSHDIPATTDPNADPLTGEPGAHPVATGIGSAAAGAAGMAIAASVAGPVGVAVAAIGGAIAGGYAGKAMGELIDPTAEDAFWRAEHPNQPYGKEAPYDDYEVAYRTGYESYPLPYSASATFEEAEPELRRRYQATGAKLSWDKAREAARLAWLRVHQQAGRTRNTDPSGEPRVESPEQRADTFLNV